MSTLRVNNMTNVSGGGPTYAPGHVIQVIQAVKSDTTTTGGTAGTWYDVPSLSATITPRSANSKIMVMVSIHLGGAATVNIYARTLRGSTTIGGGTTAGSQYVGSAMCRVMDIYTMPCLSWNYMDSPSTTDATTYKVQVASNVTNSFHINRSDNDTGGNALRPTSTITLMEVAA